MPSVKRLTADEIGILLDALDAYALLEDPDRSKDEDDAIADLAARLVGDDEAPAIEEIVVMWQEEAEADSPTTSNTAPKRRRCSACSAILAEDEGTPDPVKGAEDRVLCDTCVEEADDTEGSGLDDEEDGEELVLEA